MFFLPITLLPSLVLYHITTKKVFLVQIKALDLTFSTALDQTRISCFAGKFFTSLLSEPPGKPPVVKNPSANAGDVHFSSVQSLSRVRLFSTPWIQASLSITISRSLLRLTSIGSVMPSSHLIPCRPLLLLPPIPPSISLFQWVNSSHEVEKVLELQL